MKQGNGAEANLVTIGALHEAANLIGFLVAIIPLHSSVYTTHNGF